MAGILSQPTGKCKPYIKRYIEGIMYWKLERQAFSRNGLHGTLKDVYTAS